MQLITVLRLKTKLIKNHQCGYTLEVPETYIQMLKSDRDLFVTIRHDYLTTYILVLSYSINTFHSVKQHTDNFICSGTGNPKSQIVKNNFYLVVEYFGA